MKIVIRGCDACGIGIDEDTEKYKVVKDEEGYVVLCSDCSE